MNNVNYRVLKSNIVKSCKQTNPNTMNFKVNFDKLTSLVSDIGLTPITPVGAEAKRAIPENIPFISEYLVKNRLAWLTDAKHFTIITFIDSESIDEKAQGLLDLIAQDQIEDPENDKVNNIATLVAEYPCYFALIVSYENNDPSRIGRPSYEIICRANKVVIRDPNYQYNPKDFA